jgi:lysophospholipase L1-like esterase
MSADTQNTQQPVRKHQWKHSVLTNAVLVVSSIIVLLLCLEAGLRVYMVFFPKQMVFDSKLGWRHAANVDRTFTNEDGEKFRVVQNAQGHRGEGHEAKRTPGKFRILALGDSFTEGLQVGEEEVFTARLEHMDPRLEMLNAGVYCYSTVQEYLYFASEGLQYHPDLVLLMFYENDLTDNVQPYYPSMGPRPYANLIGGKVHVVEEIDSWEYRKFILPAPFQMTLNNYSLFYYFVNSRIYQRIFARRMSRLAADDLSKIDVPTRFEVLYQMFEKVRSVARLHNIPLVVVLIPTREEVAAGTSLTAQNIKRYCNANNLDCLDLLDRLHKETSTGARLYFHQDLHWTKEGHRIAADEIARYLRSNPVTDLAFQAR